MPIVVNAGIIGTVGYFSYINWDKPSWDRRIVSSVTVGVLALWSGEGYGVTGHRLINSDTGISSTGTSQNATAGLTNESYHWHY